MTSLNLTNPPPWLVAAGALIGVSEIPGPKSSPTIMSWVSRLKSALGMAYTDDAIPWCGVFVAHVLAEAGFVPPPVAVRAKSWASFGIGLAAGSPGAVLVFSREGGGHVGFYVSEDVAYYHVLGGNQGDSVSLTRILKSRLVPGGIRWPNNPKGGSNVMALPMPSGPVVRTWSLTTSSNEA